MNRFLAEILACTTAIAIVAVMAVAVGGLVFRTISSPPRLPHVTVPGCFEAPLVQLAGSGIDGEAKLCIADDAVRPTVRVANLTPGTAYLALFLYVDQPSACRVMPCAVADLLADSTAGILARMDATVANGTRRADFWGDFRDLSLAPGSQVTLTLLDRGAVTAADSRRRARQLLALPAALSMTPTSDPLADRSAGLAVAQAVFFHP